MCDNLVMMFYLSLLTVRPPSKAALRHVFENTSDLCAYLSIPRDKADVDSAVEYYIQSTHPRKMRRMIWVAGRDRRHRSSRLTDGVC